MQENKNNQNFLKVENISKTFEDLRVLKNINFTVKKQEVVGIIGYSGSGKTTLFNIIAGFIKPDTGKVTLDGEDITGQIGKIAYMMQDNMLLKHMKIIDNISLPLYLSGTTKENAKKEALKYFEDFGLKGSEDKYPKQISGGMAQRAALLRTFLFSDKLMFLDEPFSALDYITKENIHDWFQKTVEKYKMTVVFISHDIEEILKLSDRVLILSNNSNTIEKEMIIDKENYSSKEFILTEKFLHYKKEIIECIDI